MLREIDHGHRLAPLAGFHRNLEKHFEFDFGEKERLRKMFENLPDPEGDLQARLKSSQEFIAPPQDSNFLRKHNPLVPGQLALNLNVLRTELSLDFASSCCSLLPMCHLYNALRQLGYLDIAWPALDNLISLHIKPLFLGEVPTKDARSMLNRAALASGTPAELLRPNALNNKGDRARYRNAAVTKRRTKKAGAFE